MSHVVIYGASDDLVEIEGDAPGCDEYNAESATFLVLGVRGDRARVEVEYADSGVWKVAVSPADEDTNIPPMEIVSAGNGYSACAVIQNVERVVRIYD